MWSQKDSLFLHHLVGKLWVRITGLDSWRPENQLFIVKTQNIRSKTHFLADASHLIRGGIKAQILGFGFESQHCLSPLILQPSTGFLRPLTVFHIDCWINHAKERFGMAATSKQESTGPQASCSVSHCRGLALRCCDSYLSLQRNQCIKSFLRGCFS